MSRLDCPEEELWLKAFFYKQEASPLNSVKECGFFADDVVKEFKKRFLVVDRNEPN